MVAVGPGAYNHLTGTLVPMTATAGQEVAYDRFAGTELMVDGVPHLVMREKSILMFF